MIEKIKQLKSVEVLPQVNVLQVLWEVNIVEDGEVLTTSNHRATYGNTQKEQFVAEVEGAEKYVGLIEWISDDTTAGE